MQDSTKFSCWMWRCLCFDIASPEHGSDVLDHGHVLLAVDLPEPLVQVLAHGRAVLDHRVDHALLARRLPLAVLTGRRRWWSSWYCPPPPLSCPALKPKGTAVPLYLLERARQAARLLLAQDLLYLPVNCCFKLPLTEQSLCGGSCQLTY